jgi:hypothetical protein
MRLLLAILLFSFAPLSFAQGVVWPNAIAPCNGSLQACVDAQPAGFTVMVAQDNPTNIDVDSTLQLPRTIRLIAAAGYHPVFPAGVSIGAQLSDGMSIEIEGIGLRNQKILAFMQTGGTGSVVLRDIDIVDRDGQGGFSFLQLGNGTLDVRVENSSYLRIGGTANPVNASAQAGTLNVDLRFNRFEVPDSTSSAYGVVGAVTADGDVNLDALNNRFLGSFAYGALCGVIGTGANASSAVKLRAFHNVFTPSLYRRGVGICAFGGEGAMSAYLVNNSMVNLGLAAYLGERAFSPPASPQALTGYVFNNLIAYNDTAVQQQPAASAITNGNNLLFGNTFTGIGFTPDAASTVLADPRLVSRARPYLGSGSPAINQGNGLALVFAPGTAPPLLDADGHRRIKDGTLDIGAYEFGDAWFRAVSPNSPVASNYFEFRHPSTDANANARIQGTPTPITGATLLASYGVFRFGSPLRWAVFAQNNFTILPSGIGFNLFSAANGGGSFLHTTASSSASSQIDNVAVNGKPEAMVFVTSNWNPTGGDGVYNDHPIGVYTYADNNWYVQSGDGFGLSNGASFNVYAQDPSPSVFRLETRAETIIPVPPGAAVEIPLDEIAVACAVVVITPWTTSSDNRHYDVYRRGNGRWAIYSPSGIPDGTRFNIMYSPRQVFECSGPLFKDGFE